MIKHLTLKTRAIISLCLTALTVILFSIGVFGLLKRQFDWSILLNYFFIGSALGIYAFILMTRKFTLAFITFIVGYIISFISMLYMFNYAGDGFYDLAGIILWLIIIILVIALGLALEFIMFMRRKTKTPTPPSADIIDVDEIEDNDTKVE